MYAGAGSPARRIRRVYTCLLCAAACGSRSVTTFGGLCSVQGDRENGACENHEGRQWSVELSEKLVRRRRSNWRRFSAVAAGAWGADLDGDKSGGGELGMV
jgi:hypothetical protein